MGGGQRSEVNPNACDSRRKILNDLSSEEVAHGDGRNSPTAGGVTVPSTSIYQTSTGQYCKPPPTLYPRPLEQAQETPQSHL